MKKQRQTPNEENSIKKKKRPIFFKNVNGLKDHERFWNGFSLKETKVIWQ